MYAIAFDLDTEILSRHYPGNTPTNAYAEIRRILENRGFLWQQGSLYFGDARVVNPVHAVLAVQEVANRYVWFKAAVKDIRMLRIEENSDLMEAVGDFDELPLAGAAE